MALAAPLATASDGDLGQRPLEQPEPPAVPSFRRQRGLLEVLECEKCERYAAHSVWCFLFNYFLERP